MVYTAIPHVFLILHKTIYLCEVLSLVNIKWLVISCTNSHLLSSETTTLVKYTQSDLFNCPSILFFRESKNNDRKHLCHTAALLGKKNMFCNHLIQMRVQFGMLFLFIKLCFATGHSATTKKSIIWRTISLSV